MVYQNDSQMIEQAYNEDFAQSMQQGKEPASLQYTRSSIEQAQRSYNRIEASMGQENAYKASSVQPETNPDREAEASFQRKKQQEKAGKQPNFFTRASNKITMPFKKATGFVYTQRQNHLKRHIDNEMSFMELHQERMNAKQDQLNRLVERQQEKEARRQSFINQIKDKAGKAKDGVQKTFDVIGKTVSEAKERGRDLPQFGHRFVQDIKDGYETYRSFGQDIVDQGAEKFQAFRERMNERKESENTGASENELVDQMTQRMKEKHQERDEFNEMMDSVHGKNVGYQSLSVDEGLAPDEANQMAHLETRDFMVPTKNGEMSVIPNPAYYKYMMDMKAEAALAETNGQMSDADYRDRAKELYEYLSEERSESQTKEVFDKKLMESYETPYRSKRMGLYLAKNPPLTKPDDNLTKTDVQKEYDGADYNVSSSSENNERSWEQEKEQKQSQKEARRGQTINREFNGAEMNHEGYVDLDQDVPSAAYVYATPAQQTAQMSDSDTAALKQLFEIERDYSNNAIQKHRQLDPVIDMSSPSGPGL